MIAGTGMDERISLLNTTSAMLYFVEMYVQI